MTRIETYRFTPVVASGSAPFLGSIGFEERRVRIDIVSFPDLANRLTAVLPNALIESMSFDISEIVKWPVDIIGVDCYELGDRWRFVLHCTEAEWIWQSEWPNWQATR